MIPDRLRAAGARLLAVRWRIAVAVLAGVAGTVGSYAVAGTTPGFVAAPIAGFLARTLPGEVLTVAIVLLGSLGQQLNLLTAIGMATAVFALLAGVGMLIGERIDVPALGVLVGGGASGVVAFGLAGAPYPALGSAAGVALVTALADARAFDRPIATDAGRRGAIRALAGTVGVVALGASVRASDLLDPEPRGTAAPTSSNGMTDTTAPSDDESGSDRPADPSSEVEGHLSLAADQSLDVEGLEPLVSDEFYEVDIAAVNPNLDAGDWTLSFTGAVAEERTIDYETLTGMAAEHRFVTLRCVGESLNGKKMDNALWTGVPAAALLEDLEIQSGCGCVMLRAADDYYQQFPLAALERGFLAWGMNGGDLPREHGFPVRALVPGHWGEINVKWLTEIEFLQEEARGFWEERGWHGTGPVNTVAKLHVTNRPEDGRIQVGGHAYAGTRGVDRVEVSTDGGSSWEAATLSEPLPGEDVWRQWIHEYDSPGARHEVVVRTIDGAGQVQAEDRTPAFPSGATGWVSQSLDG